MLSKHNKMKTFNVNPADYYPHFVDNQYPEYLNKVDGSCPFKQGDVVFDENNQSVGIVLGNIDEKDGTLRLDSDGVQAYAEMRPATLDDFETKDALYQECEKQIKSR